MLRCTLVVVMIAAAHAEAHGQPMEPPAAPATDELVVDEWAPEPALVDYVSASTKLTEPARRSPSSVWVVTREQIELAGYRSVAEALTHVPGLAVSYDLDNYNVALRGLYGGARAGSRFIKVMIDGRAISFAQSGVHYLGPEFIPIAAVERIEVVRGPVSSLYGAGALVGAINIVTRRPSYEGVFTAASLLDGGGAMSGARGGNGQGLQMLIGERSFLLVAVGAGYQDRSGLEVPSDSAFHGDFVDETTGTPVRSRNDIARPISALVRGEHYVGGGRLAGVGALQLHDAVNEFHDLYALGHGNRSRLYTGGGSVSFERATRSRLTILTSAGVWVGGTRDGERYDLDPMATFALTRRLSYQLFEGGLELRYDADRGGWLQLGIDGQYDRERLPLILEIDRQTREERPRPGSGRRERLANGAIYAQLLLPLVDSVRIAGTVRWDQHNIYGGAFSARAAVVFTPTPRLAIKLMGGRSYKAPSPEQLFGIGLSELDVTGNETIEPQYLNGIEALVDYYIAKQLHLNIGTYYQRYVDALSYVRMGTGLVATPFDADSIGIEAALRMSAPLGPVRVEMTTGGALQRLTTESRIVGGVREKPVPDNEGVPTALASARLAVFGPERSGGQVTIRYVGARTPSQSNLVQDSRDPDLTFPSYMLRPYVALDVSVASPTISLTPGEEQQNATVQLRAGVANVLDERHAEIGFNGVDVPSPGRTVWIGAAIAF